MKKIVSITIEKDIWDFMEKSFTNKSAMIEALIRQYYIKNNINIKTETELPKEVEEIFNERTT